MDIRDIILQAGTNGKIFTVVFIKRTTGEVRTMTCRLGVHKYVKGIGLAYDPRAYNLLGVYDMQLAAHGKTPLDKCYRMVNLEEVLEVRGEKGKILWKK